MLPVTSGVAQVGNLEIAYDTRGEGEPLLLIAGFGMPRDMWSETFADVLASRGFLVVRMDNRDTGASTRLTILGMPPAQKMLLRSVLGLRVESPYRLEDMADDAVGLMKSLGHARFHVAGASMGGMIAQTLALDRADKLFSMTSIMSSPGGRRYSVAKPSAFKAILTPLPKEPKAQLARYVEVLRIIAGTGLPYDEEAGRKLAAILVAAKPSTSGSARQLTAILESSGRRRARLSSIRTPTLVIHGSHDPLLPVRGSRAMAKVIPGAELLIVEGMGHHFPEQRYDTLADAIQRVTHRASPAKN